MSRLSVLALVVAPLACDRSSAPQRGLADRAATQVASAPPLERAPSSAQTLSQAANVASFWADQKLVRNGGMEIRVADVQRASRSADTIARAHGAQLADSRVSEDAADGRHAHLVFRIPSDRFAETSASLRQLGDVRSETVNTEDVTKEYADLETRLAVQQQTVTRLRGLLDSRTAKLSDVLDVERELSRAVTELEQMKGERRYYDQQIALSTLTLDLFESAHSRASQLTTPLGRAWHDALAVLGTSLGVVVYAAVFLLPWAGLGVAAWWLVRRLRRATSP